MLLATAIFVGALALIASDRFDRTTFLGLFVMVGALEETGVVDEITEGIISITAGDRTAELLGIAWMAAKSGQPIGFLESLRVGMPVTLVSMVLVTGYILLRYI